jgi:hypothetical protein
MGRGYYALVLSPYSLLSENAPLYHEVKRCMLILAKPEANFGDEV